MDAHLQPEEPWEAEIEAMLGGLGDVEPPDGFLESALDHHPLYAGRILAGLVAAAVLAVGATLALSIADRPDGFGLDNLLTSLPGGDSRYEHDEPVSEPKEKAELGRETLDLATKLAEQLGFPPAD